MSSKKHQVAIISIGTELTQGFTLNSNAHWLAGRLRDLGFDTAYQVTLPDDAKAWKATWNMIRETGIHTVLVGGGLGPTADDRTRDLIAETLNRRLVHHPECEAAIQAWFASRGKPYSPTNRVQANIPEGADVLENTAGTAPGFRLTEGDITLFVTPGVPSEVRIMFEAHIAPWLEAQGVSKLHSRETRLTGITESELESRLRQVDFTEDVSWSSLPVKDSILLRTYTHASPEILDTVQGRFEKALGDVAETGIISRDGKSLVQVLMDQLRASHTKMATAESCTGGLIASEIVSEPGSSDIFAGSVVAYQNEIKNKILGVPQALLDQHGAVSEPVVRAMAEGAARLFGCPWAVATSGIAGPGGGTADKPVGLVWMAVATPQGTQSFHEKFLGSREQIRIRSVYTVLNRLRQAIAEQNNTCT